MIYIGYSFMSKNFEGIIKSGDIYLPYLLNTVVELIKSILISITGAVVVIAAIDYGYEKFSHKKGLKMTKQEVKEEYKQMEATQVFVCADFLDILRFPHIGGEVVLAKQLFNSFTALATEVNARFVDIVHRV